MSENDPIPSRVDRALTIAGKGHSPDGRLHQTTMARYMRAWGEYERWRRTKGLPATLTSESLAEYAEALLEQGYAKATARGKIAALKAVCRLRGEPVPDGVAVWYVLRDGDSTSDSDDRPTPEVVRRGALARVVSCLDQGKAVAAARDRCLVTLAWALPVSEPALVGLNVDDVRPDPDGVAVRADGRWLLVPHDHDPVEVCAVEATQEWLAVLAGAGARSGPLIRSVDAAQNIGGCGPKAGTAGELGRLNVRGLRRIWARAVVRAGLPPSTPRALRLGGAVDDLVEGADLTDVLARGWSPHSAGTARRLVDLAAQQTGGSGGRSAVGAG